MRRTIPTVIAAAALTLAGCSSSPATSQDVSMAACDAFAHYLRGADGDPTAMDRATTVEQVAVELEDGPAPDERITDALEVMRRTVEGPADAWLIGADMFAAACMDLGWEA